MTDCDDQLNKAMAKPTTATSSTAISAGKDDIADNNSAATKVSASPSSLPSSSASQFPVFASFTTDEKDLIKKLQQLGCDVRDLKLLIASNKKGNDDHTDKKEEINNDEDAETLKQMLSQMDDIKIRLAKSLLREVKKLLRILEGKDPNTNNFNEVDLESEASQLSKFMPAGKPRKDMEKRLKSIRKQRKAAVQNKLPPFDKTLHTQSLRIQRKIHHLLSSSGSGGTFCYHPNELNTDKHHLHPNQNVVLTEKWDGTTVQATNKGIFKRFDKFSKGDVRKFQTKSEEERYGIERLDVGFDEFLIAMDPGSGKGSGDTRKKGDKSCKYIREAVEQYYPIFASMDDDLCVYFEAVGTKIQARYRTSNLVPSTTAVVKDDDDDDEYWHDIRVFDFARNGRFLSWDETKSLALKLKLPLVGYTDPPMALDVGQILTMLHSSLTYDVKSDVNHPANGALLEGFVVRGVTYQIQGENEEVDKQQQIEEDGEEEPIAKIRVEDLEQFAQDATEKGEGR